MHKPFGVHVVPHFLPLSSRSEQVCLASSDLLHAHPALAGTRFNHYLLLCHIVVLADAGDPQQYQTTQPKKGTSADFSKKLDMFKQQTGSPVAKVCPPCISTRSILRLFGHSCSDDVAQTIIHDSVACLLHSRVDMLICLDSGCMSCKTWATFPGKFCNGRFCCMDLSSAQFHQITVVQAAQGVQQSLQPSHRSAHTNCIVDLQLLHGQSQQHADKLATADLDGRIVLWDVAKVLAQSC